MRTVPRPDRLVDDMLAHGRFAVTTSQAAETLAIPEAQVRVRFHRLVREGRLFTPTRGLWIAVPPQFRTWGTLPGLQFLDAMMIHLNRDYYVGWLSAAELHGAAHQRPQVLQVAVDRSTADRDLGRVRLRFIQRHHLADLPRAQRNTPTGQVWVATPEVTALDLADDPRQGGGVSNAATVLAELVEDGRIDPPALVAAADMFPLAAQRRLGYLLDLIGADRLAAGLHDLVERRHHHPAQPLAPGATPPGTAIDQRWRVVLNTEVEPDL